jgi:ATP-dependent RNA helicase DHX57
VTILRRAEGKGGSSSSSALGGGGGGSKGGRFAAGIDAAAAEAAEAATALLEDPAVAELAMYGYPPREAATALEQAAGHVQPALALLHDRLAAAATGDSSRSNGAAAAVDASSAADGAELAEWQEERLVLEAIYGADASFPSERHTAIRLPVELTSAAAMSAAGGQHELQLQLDFFAPTAASAGGAGASSSSPVYPQCPPVVGVRAEGVPGAALLTLTRQLAEQAAELAGHPMLYELSSAAAESFERCLLQPLPRLLPPAGAAAAARDAELAQQAERALRLEDIANTVIPAASRRPRQQGGGYGGGLDLAAESRHLQQRQRELDTGAELAAMRGVRSRLPAAAQRGEVLALCGSRRVVVVSGATGCGKSTQASRPVGEAAGSRGHALNLSSPAAQYDLILPCLNLPAFFSPACLPACLPAGAPIPVGRSHRRRLRCRLQHHCDAAPPHLSCGPCHSRGSRAGGGGGSHSGLLRQAG